MRSFAQTGAFQHADHRQDQPDDGDVTAGDEGFAEAGDDGEQVHTAGEAGGNGRDRDHEQRV